MYTLPAARATVRRRVYTVPAARATVRRRSRTETTGWKIILDIPENTCSGNRNNWDEQN